MMPIRTGPILRWPLIIIGVAVVVIVSLMQWLF